jgi:peptidoglycan/xylan/chitin deacetylase (PgdA/CDA1 family)
MIAEGVRTLFHAVGGPRIVRSLRRQGTRVLMYHRFPPAHRTAAERQIAHLCRNYRIASLTQVGRCFKDGVAPGPRSVVVTVDDGYEDFYTVAYPIFRKYNVPALLFLTTGFLDRTCWLWGDRVLYCLREARIREVGIEAAPGRLLRLETGPGCAPNSAACLKAVLKHLTPRARRQKLNELEELSGVRVPDAVPAEFRACSWDQIREMARNGIEFGAHSVTHPPLSTVDDPPELRFEMLESQRRIEQELQKPVRHFAYPFGGWGDFGLDAVEIARQSFDTAVSAEPGWNYPATDSHQLFRTAAQPQGSFDLFERRMAGLNACVRNGQPRPPSPARDSRG